MAGANLPAKKYKKTSPTILRLSFEGTGGGTKFIDIARALSIVNRKFYRQGVYYYVNSVEFYNNNDHYVDLHTVPDNWITKNAWNRGFKIWQKMNSLVETPRPKYNDFKCLMRYDHLADGSNTLDPDFFGINGIHTSEGPDEWVYSRFTTMVSDGGDSDEFEVTILGTHVGNEHTRDTVGLIRSYQDSRGQPTSLGEPYTTANHDTDPLLNLFDASGDLALRDIAANLEEDNDVPPYDASAYIGHNANHMQHVARLATTTTTGRVAKASGFCAPFGLICVDPSNQNTEQDTWRIVLNLAAGTYHGVYAERA